MRALPLVLATAATLTFATITNAQSAAGSLSQAQIQQLLSEQGYTDIQKVEFDDGLWEAKVTSGDGKDVKVKIDPVSGRVYLEDGKAISKLTDQDVRAALTTQGYSNIRDLKLKDGLWQADADDSQSQKKALKLDPEDGAIISVQND